MVKPLGPIPEPPPKRPEGKLPRCEEVVRCFACGRTALSPKEWIFDRIYCENVLGDGQERLKVTCLICGYVWHERLVSAPMSEYDMALEEWRRRLREIGRGARPRPRGIWRLWAWVTRRTIWAPHKWAGYR